MENFISIQSTIHEYGLFVEHAEEDLVAADTTDKVLAIQDHLLEVINTSGRLLVQLHQPRESTPILALEATEISTHLQHIVAHAKTILVAVEKKQHEQMRKLVGPPTVPADVKSIDDLFVSLRASNVPPALITRFKDLVVRFTGGEATNGERRYTKADIELLITLDPLLQDMPDTAQLCELVVEVRSAIQGAFHKRLDVLRDRAIPAETMPRNNPDKHQYLCDCHDLYWDFHCPLENQIAFTQFIEICSDTTITEYLGTPLLDEALKSKLAQLEHRKGAIERNVKLLNMTLSPQEQSALMNHKVGYLQSKMEENRAKLQKIPDVVILGGGPGGLMRALAGGLKGAHVQVFEKRQAATRANTIKLGDVSSLNYFGVLDLLRSQNKLGLLSDQPNVQIMNLEKALTEMLNRLLGSGIVHIGHELADIRVGRRNDEGPIEAGCLTKATGTDEPAIWHRADIIVDSTGAGAAAAKILGNVSEDYSKPMCMVATVIRPRPHEEEAEYEEGGAKVSATFPFQDEASGWYALGLDTPDREYLQIQPDPDTQARLMTLQFEIRSLPQGRAKQAKEAELQKLVSDIAIAKATQKLGSAFRPDDVESAGAFPVQVGSRQSAILLGPSLVMQSGDALTTPDPKTGLGANTAIKGATVFSKALDDLENPRSGPEQRYRNFVFGAEQQSKVVVEVAAAVRSGEDTFATINFALNQLTQGGEILTKAQGQLIQRLLRKQTDHIPFTPQERSALTAIKIAWDSKKDQFNIEDWYDLFEQAMIDLSVS